MLLKSYRFSLAQKLSSHVNTNTLSSVANLSVALGLASLLATGVTAPREAQAADVFVNCTSGFFDQPTCWSSLLPDENDRAVSSSNGTSTLRFDGATLANWQATTGSSASSVTNDSMLIQNGITTFRSENEFFFIYSTINDLLVNSGGTLNVGDAALDRNMGMNIGGNAIIETGGNLNISNVGSQVDVAGEMFLGDSASPSLETSRLNILSGGRLISNGARIGRNGATGIAVVDGSGSRWINSGNLTIGTNLNSSGYLSVLNGANVSTDNGIIASGNQTTGTLTLSGADSILTNTSDFIVGNRGSATLMVDEMARVTSAQGYLARFESSTATATIDGAGSSWVNTGAVVVGEAGDATLNILNGALVNSASGTIAQGATSTGIVNVSGAGSVWANSDGLTVGQVGSGTLNVSAGGSVSSTFGYLGRNTRSVGAAILSGAGSSWTLSNNLFVGEQGTGTLDILDGASVTSIIGSVGFQSAGSGVVTVSGAGSAWNNQSLRVGSSPFFNPDPGNGTVNITNGGLLVNNTASVGAATGSTGTVTVLGSGSRWTNNDDLSIGSFGNGTLEINQGGVVTSFVTYAGRASAGIGNISVGGAGPVSTLQTPGISIGEAGTGTLSVGDFGLLITREGIVGNLAGSTGTVSLTGKDAEWRNQGSLNALTIGNSGSGTLAIAGGAQVTVDSALSFGSTVGANAGSTGTVTVDGPASIWESGALTVGNGGRGTLTISNGAVVTGSGSGAAIANEIGSTGLVSVVGNLSAWGVSGDLLVANQGSGTLDILNGGRMSNASAIIGQTFGSTGVATVDGAGSSWISTGELRVGSVGSGSLAITSGGSVSSASAIVASSAGSIGSVRIAGTDSAWTNAGELWVGSIGRGTLAIESGGNVNSGVVSVSRFGGQGSATVDGIGSTWTSDTFLVGQAGFGTLDITNGGDVSSTDGIIGQSSLSNGRVAVEGVGSKWSMSSDLTVAETGRGELEILNGGTVSSSSGSIGFAANSIGTARVDGAGSSWNNAGNLFVGNSGTGTLNVLNGGSVSNFFNASIGRSAGSTGTVTVDGAGSTWASGPLIVGVSGTGTLNVLNGGSVSNTLLGLIGNGTGSTGTVTVDGTGSTWTNSSDLRVGILGSGILNIGNGGSVSSSFGFIGLGADSTGVVTVDSAGSSWNNAGSLFVGNSGTGTLAIRDGGSVSSLAGFISFSPDSAGTVTVDGAGSRLENADALYVGGSSTSAGGNGVLNVTNNGGATVGGQLKIWETGTLNLTDGSLAANSLDIHGTFNFGSGTITVTEDFRLAGGDLSLSAADLLAVVGTTTIEAGVSMSLESTAFSTGALNINGAFDFISGTLSVADDLQLAGSDLSLGAGDLLTVGGTTTIDTGNTLTLNGTTYSTGALQNNGTFDFVQGQFNLTNSDLIVGAAGPLGDTVSFNAQQIVNVSQSTTINNDGLLFIESGSLTSNNYANNGEVVLSGFQARARGNTFTNSGLLHGEGRVDATLVNQAAGQVQVQGLQRIRFTNSGNTNAGAINAYGGTVEFTQDLVNNDEINLVNGTLEVGGALTNSGSGFIAGRGILAANGGLTNEGNVAFSGTSDVFGDVINTGAGRFVISGASTVTFFDDVFNNGAELRVSSGASAVFLGEFTGAGAITGAGTSFFEGDLRPGNSPGLLTIVGDSVFGFTNTTTMELAGLERGTEYDAVNVGGTLTLNNRLEVVLLEGFDVGLGDTFDLFMASNIEGAFRFTTLPELEGSLFWTTQIIDLGSNEVFRAQVVPIPAAVWMFGSGLALLGWFRRWTTAQ